MEEKISVIVPVYNVEQYINRCVKSIVSQSYVNLEIILVDDGSLDNCPGICDEWEKRDDRIRVIHKTNGGLSDARNAGLEKATGEYILFVDSDDYIEKFACQKLYETISITKTDFVVGVAKNVSQKGIAFQKRSNIEENVPLDHKAFIISSIKDGEWYAPAWLNLYNRQFLKKNNLWFKKGIIHEDIEFLPRIYLAARYISYCKYPFYNYVIRDNSIMTSKITDKRINDTMKIYHLWKRQFDEIHDDELRKYLYGNLVRQYLFSCRSLGISSWMIPEIDFKFSYKNALGCKDKMKVLLFKFLPCIYIKMKH